VAFYNFKHHHHNHHRHRSMSAACDHSWEPIYNEF